MIHKSLRVGVATIGVALVLRSAAYAGGQTFTLSTSSLVPKPDGYLYCKVMATSKTPIGIVANILTEDGMDVTEFGYGSRVSPAAMGDGLYHAEETAGSMNDGARFCTVTVSGAHKKDTDVSLTAFDANGNPVATMDAYSALAGVNAAPDLASTGPVCTCIGDADKNGVIDSADLAAVQANFGHAADPATGLGDADCNGFVNSSDFAAVQANLGHPCP